jgi:hypothetical protein
VGFAFLVSLIVVVEVRAEQDPLPSWNAGPAKQQAILELRHHMYEPLSQHRDPCRRGPLCLRRGALRIVETYVEPDPPWVACEPAANIGFGVTEASRGLLYHRYRLEADGSIAEARVVPPTAQNQASIEADLMSFIGGALDLPDVALQHRCEQTIRNYDPCISCSTHVVRRDLDRA